MPAPNRPTANGAAAAPARSPVQRQRPGPAPPPAAGSILSRIQPMSAFVNDYVKMGVYGDSATGKTTFWSTFPGPILVILTSGGMKPGELKSIVTPENLDKVSGFAPATGKEYHDLLAAAKADGRYATVVADHGSGLQDLLLHDILGKDIPVQKLWGLADQKQWGQVSFQFKEIMRSLLNFDANVVITAHQRVFKNEGNDSAEILKPFVAGALSPSTVNWLNGAVDYLGHTYRRQITRDIDQTVGVGPQAKTMSVRVKVPGEFEFCMRTGIHDIYATKFRLPKGYPLPAVIRNPTYDKIRAIIRGEDPGETQEELEP